MFHVKQLKNNICYGITMMLFGCLNLILFIYPMTQGYMNIGGYTGVGIGLLEIVAGMLELLEKTPKSRGLSNGLMILNILTGIFIFIVSVINYIEVESQNGENFDSKVFIILGCEVNDNGTPSKMLVSRLEAAYDLSFDKGESIYITTGGYPENSKVSEAESMENWLVQKGVLQRRIFVDSEAKSTEENIENAKIIIIENDIEGEIVVVTNDYHALRTKWCANKNDLRIKIYKAHTPWWLVPTYYIRELYGIVYYAIS